MVFREDATVRPLRVVVTVPARSTLSSVKDALADLLNARDGVVFELRETKKGGRVFPVRCERKVEDIDYDYDLVAYELDAGLANERTVNVFMGARSMYSDDVSASLSGSCDVRKIWLAHLHGICRRRDVRGRAKGRRCAVRALRRSGHGHRAPRLHRQQRRNDRKTRLAGGRRAPAGRRPKTVVAWTG